jgi:uncharacterized protein YndB with AHSA1/START domain
MTTTEQPMGAPLFAEGRWGVRFERRLAHPPEKVWRAITESEHLVHWMPTDIVGERRAGAPIDLPFWPEAVAKYDIEDPVMHGEIRVWDPPRVFEWTWDTDLLRWELEPDGEHTVLTFSTWFGEDDDEIVAGASGGYHVCLDQLRAWLDTGAVTPIDDDEMAAWLARYAAAIEAHATATATS